VKFENVEEVRLPFAISLSDYSTTSKIVVFYVSQSNSVFFKNCSTDMRPFEGLSEIQMNHPVKHLRLSNCYLFLSTTCTLEKWNLTKKEAEVMIEEMNITSLACSSDSCYFVSDFTLKQLKIDAEHKILTKEDLKIGTITELKQGVTSISLASKKYLYILGQLDLSLFDVSSQGFTFLCSFKFDSLNLKVIADSHYLYTYSKGHILRIQTQEDLRMEKLAEVEDSIVDYQYCHDNTLFIATSKNVIFKYSVDIGKLTYVEQIRKEYYEDEITCISVNPIKFEIAVGSKESTIKIFSTENLDQLRIIPNHKLPISKVCHLHSSLISVGYYEDQVEVFMESTQKIIDQFRLTQTSTTKGIFCTNNSEFLYILQAESIISYNFNGKKEEKMTTRNDGTLYFKCDDLYMVIVNEKTIEVREVKTLEVVCSADYHKVTKSENICAIGISSNFLIISTSNTIHCLSIENKVFVGNIDIKVKIKDIMFFNHIILLWVDKEIYKIPNFNEKGSESFIVGPSTPSLAFICALKETLEGKELPDHIFSWTLLPQCINIIHLFAYNCSRDQVKKSFKSEGNLLKSIADISPLTISLKKGFKDISEYLIKKIARESISRPNILSIIEQDLASINRSHIGPISEIYKQAMSESNQIKLPSYIIPLKPDQIIISKGYMIDPSNFINKAAGPQAESFVTFFNSNMRLQFATGSEGCVNFLSSLIACQDSQVFSTQIIKNYLNFKWENASTYLRLNFFVYILFLLLITVEDKIKNYTWRIVALALVLLINSLGLVVEYLQIRFNFKAYIRSKTNWTDLTRIFLTFLYVVMVLVGEESEQSKKDKIGYSTIVLFASYLRGIMHFKMFKSTRYMIKMIEEIIKDSFFFAIILVYILCAFTTFYHFARTGASYTESFSIVYLIMFGEFGFDKESIIEWICFYCISIGLPLVMFNLLVAIMGGTYQRVYGSIVENDFKAMTQLILECEIVRSAFTNPENSQMYIQRCIVGSEVETNSDESINSKIKDCINHVNELQEKIKNFKSTSLVESCSRYKNEKMEKLEAFKTLVEQNKKEILEKVNQSLQKLK
jgi:WD40 repeat protein